MSEKSKNYVSIGFFAFFGGALRCYFNLLWSTYGTLLANVVGCFLLAAITYFFVEYKAAPQWLITGLTTGLVGAFTTFSTFQLDTLKYLQSGQWINGIFYFFISLALGFTFAYFGMKTGIELGKKVENK